MSKNTKPKRKLADQERKDFNMISLGEIAKEIRDYKIQGILDSGENDMFDEPIKKKYKIMFCFLDKNGMVERDKEEQEIYHDEEVEAESEEMAVKKFKEQFMYDDLIKPEIVEVIRR